MTMAAPDRVRHALMGEVHGVSGVASTHAYIIHAASTLLTHLIWQSTLDSHRSTGSGLEHLVVLSPPHSARHMLS